MILVSKILHSYFLKHLSIKTLNLNKTTKYIINILFLTDEDGSSSSGSDSDSSSGDEEDEESLFLFI